MRILFCREKWADGRPELGLSDGEYCIPTLARNGLGAASVFYWDTVPDEERNLAVYRAAQEFQPDIVMFSALLSWGDRNVGKEVWTELRKTAKVVGIWHEGIAPDVVRVADEYADCVDLNLFIDTKDQFLKHTKRPEKCLGLYDPRDVGAFNSTRAFVGRDEEPPPPPRNIPVSFVGTLVARPVRCAGVFTLLANGVPVAKLGGRSEWFVSEPEMIGCLWRSKIGLNFSDAGPYRHYKGRIAEILLCDAMLMELENDETASILDPFKDYVPFSNPDDLLAKVRYYLAHDAERERIAKSGREKATERLTGREFWTALFEKLNIE